MGCFRHWVKTPFANAIFVPFSLCLCLLGMSVSYVPIAAGRDVEYPARKVMLVPGNNVPNAIP